MKKISLSQQWVRLSKAFYGQEFKEELANFLKQNNVKTVLECGCGDGDVLYGLAQKGFRGVGIDSDKEMISMAFKNHQHSNIKYLCMNWLEIDKLPEKYDAVLCRGNSLIYILSWKKKRLNFNANKTRSMIENGIEKMYGKLKEGGILYIDTISQSEIDNNGGNFKIKIKDINLNVRIEYDWTKKTRYISGAGSIGDNKILGTSISYLLTPNELEDIIRNLNPKRIWRPNLEKEMNYTIICAIK